MIIENTWTPLPMGMRGRQIGEEYEYELAKPPLRFTLSGVRESRNGLSGEVQVESIQSGNEGDIIRDHLTLISTRSKNAFAKAIGVRTKLAMPWPEIVELIALTTADTFRRGEPFIFLKDTTDDPKDRAFLIRYFLPYHQTTVLYGDGMAGKSLLALTMAIAVATGKELPGIVPMEEPQAVLYLDWETTPAIHAYYLRCIERAHDINVPRERLLYRRMARSLALESRAIKREVDKHEVGFLVVDSMVPACGGEPESAEVVMQFFNAIRGIGPVTTQAISHVTKFEAQRKGLPRPFGSVFTTNLARSTWLARRAELGDSQVLEIGLYHTKTNFGRLFSPQGVRYQFGQDEITLSDFYVDEVPELDVHVPLGGRIRGILKRGPATVKDIADKLDATPATVRRTLHRMADATTVPGSNGGERGQVKAWGLRTYESETTTRLPGQTKMDDIDGIPF